MRATSFIPKLLFVVSSVLITPPTFAQESEDLSEETEKAAPKAAAEEKKPIEALVKFIGPRGEKLDLQWETKTDWAWSRPKSKKGLPRPVLRTWVQIPSDYEVQSVKGAGIRFDLEPEYSPLDDSIAIDMQSSTGSATIFARKEKGEVEEIGILIQAQVPGPGMLVHETCEEAGLSYRLQKKGGRHFYSGLYCRTKGDKVLLLILHSPDSQWKGEKTIKTFAQVRRKGKTAQMFLVNLGHKKLKPNQAFIRFKLGSRGDLDAGMHEVFWTGDSLKGSRWSFSVGLGPTYLQYTEEPLQAGTNRTTISLKEFVLTGKFAASYRLSKSVDLGGNIFGNIVKITQTPSDQEFARFYGINARVGYTLPFSKKITYRALLGWYYWGMLVSNNAYGIKSIAGPQIFLTATAGERPYTVYFKFAPVSDSLSNLSFSNREIAGGVAYRINSLRAKNPLFLSFNVADTRASSETAGISAKVTSFSLGVDYGF